MADGLLKSQSTKVAQPVPVEFRQIFVQHGWDRVNHLFGKRASSRYFTVLGADRLRAERVAHLHARRSAALGRGGSAAAHVAAYGVPRPQDVEAVRIASRVRMLTA